MVWQISRVLKANAEKMRVDKRFTWLALPESSESSRRRESSPGILHRGAAGITSIVCKFLGNWLPVSGNAAPGAARRRLDRFGGPGRDRTDDLFHAISLCGVCP